MSVLFVDDDPQALQTLDDLVLDAGIDWDCEFALTGEEALEIMARSEFRAIVTDLRMPRMDGATLLNLVAKRHPNVVRVVLSDPADRQLVLRAVDSMHQFLPKPCDAGRLKATIDRACFVRDRLQNDTLRGLIGGLSRLPSVPALYRELIEALRDEETSIQTIGEIVAQDAAMTAKILQLVNSAIFCVRHPVADPVRAVSLLGASTLKSLVLAIGVFQEFQSLGAGDFSADELMRHGLEVAQLAAAIGQCEGLDGFAIEDAVTAATLHDLGKLILHAVDAESYRQARQLAQSADLPPWRAEQRVYGADHAAAGAYLLSLWGLPPSIVEAVALHHTPTMSGEITCSALTAVTAANFLSHAVKRARFPDPDPELARYLEMVCCGTRLQDWRKLAIAGRNAAAKRV